MLLPPLPLEPTEIIGGCIALYKNAWPNPDATIEAVERVAADPTNEIAFADAVLMNGRKSTHRTNKDMSITNFGRVNSDIRAVNNQFFDLCHSAVLSYTKHFNITQKIFYKETLNMLKYQTGEEYKAHYDGATGSRRSISPIVYLNDDYTGGELEFVNFGITIKPEKGLLVIFPSNFPYTHIAHPVKTGTKYALVTWLHDREA